jgi:hypothetical protein
MTDKEFVLSLYPTAAYIQGDYMLAAETIEDGKHRTYILGFGSRRRAWINAANYLKMRILRQFEQ